MVGASPMTDAPDLYVKVYDRRDPRLGRVVVHDPRSRAFALNAPVDSSTWVSHRVRVYDPIPNPNQCHGECTGVAKCVQLNAAGNRRTGVVLGMDDAHGTYSLASTLDPFAGSWTSPSWDDTGSSGLAAAKAAQQRGSGGVYRFLFGGADEVVQATQPSVDHPYGQVVNVGTRWNDRMFDQDASGQIQLGGPVAGGHEWSVRGYDVDRDLVLGRCWWGSFRDFWIRRTDLAELLADDGDAHVQARAL